MRAQFKQTRARHQHAGNAKPYVTLFLNIRSNAYIGDEEELSQRVGESCVEEWEQKIC